MMAVRIKQIANKPNVWRKGNVDMCLSAAWRQRIMPLMMISLSRIPRNTVGTGLDAAGPWDRMIPLGRRLPSPLAWTGFRLSQEGFAMRKMGFVVICGLFLVISAVAFATSLSDLPAVAQNKILSAME